MGHWPIDQVHNKGRFMVNQSHAIGLTDIMAHMAETWFMVDWVYSFGLPHK